MTSQIFSKNNENEIELINYLYPFWQSKWKVLIITLLCLTLGEFYIRFSTPVFETRTFIYPPSLGDIASLNADRLIKFSTQKKNYTVEVAYDVFSYYLLADSTKKIFLKEMLSSVNEDREKESIQRAINYFYNTLIVRIIPGIRPAKYLISAKGENPEQVVNWLEKYLALSNKRAATEIVKNITLEKEKIIDELQNKIAAVKEARDDLSKSNLEDKFLFSVLQKLQIQLNYYKKININSTDVSLFRLDEKIEKPVLPVLPRKKLVLILSFFCGLFLSVLIIVLQRLISHGFINKIRKVLIQ